MKEIKIGDINYDLPALAQECTKALKKGLTLRERLGLLARGEVITRGRLEGYFINQNGHLKMVMRHGLQVGCNAMDLFTYPDEEWSILKLASSGNDPSHALVSDMP